MKKFQFPKTLGTRHVVIESLSSSKIPLEVRDFSLEEMSENLFCVLDVYTKREDLIESKKILNDCSVFYADIQRKFLESCALCKLSGMSDLDLLQLKRSLQFGDDALLQHLFSQFPQIPLRKFWNEMVTLEALNDFLAEMYRQRNNKSEEFLIKTWLDIYEHTKEAYQRGWDGLAIGDENDYSVKNNKNTN